MSFNEDIHLVRDKIINRSITVAAVTVLVSISLFYNLFTKSIQITIAQTEELTKALKKLRISERKYRTVIEKSNDDLNAHQLSLLEKSGEGGNKIEVVLYHKTGIKIPIEASVYSVDFNDDEFLWGVMRDLRPIKKLENKVFTTMVSAEEIERGRYAKELHDSRAFLNGLQFILSRNKQYQVIDVCHDGGKLIDSKILNQAHLILADIEIPIYNDIEAAKPINFRFPKLPMITLTIHQDKVYLLDIVTAGFKGFIYKPEFPKKIHQVIEEVLNNNRIFSRIFKITK